MSDVRDDSECWLRVRKAVKVTKRSIDPITIFTVSEERL